MFKLLTVNYKIPPVLNPSITTSDNGDSDSLEVTGEPTDCFSDRKTALSEGTILYLPECTPDGRYQKVSFLEKSSFLFFCRYVNKFNLPDN